MSKKTTVTDGRRGGGGDRAPIDDNGFVETPFRDGAHALWDRETLGLRAWAVYKKTRTEVIRKAPAMNGGK